jgi:hypothetical protein
MNEAAAHLLAAQKVPPGTRRAGTGEPDDDGPSPPRDRQRPSLIRAR